MTYQEALDYLFDKTANYEKQGTSGYKPGLDTMLALDEYYGHPHSKYRTIHVAGTNGKGSVSHTLAAQLQVCGYRVGLYTSPHLVDFKERIRINGNTIDEEYVTRFIDQERDVYEPYAPTFFELTTLMAFKYFADNNVDIAVIEVGLGGRLDSTNIITPILSVITNVSLDHTQLLGSTVEQIAMEKAGIMKKDVPCVIGEASESLRAVFDAVAQDTGTELVYAEDNMVIEKAEELPDGGMQYDAILGFHFKGELEGDFQAKNTNTVLTAVHELMKKGYFCDCQLPQNVEKIQEEMERAFMNVTTLTGLQGRWQTVSRNPLVVCDTGHNPGAWKYLSKKLENAKCNELRIVIGILEDKEVYDIMAMMPKRAKYYFTKGSTKRALPEATLKVFGDQFGLQGKSYPTVPDAVKAAMDDANSDDFIFVGGSNYVVADFLKSRI
ncbi:MAG: bifunctional folylpolyglutamate synthase/dihydrofolate synthase [Prevotella sp.]|nr:bifunctional folylpolyglutamate synthase/dihydrofolate synthase [Prevotella sp.]